MVLNENYSELRQFSQSVFGNKACFSDTYQRTRKGKREIVRKKRRVALIVGAGLIGTALGSYLYARRGRADRIKVKDFKVTMPDIDFENVYKQAKKTQEDILRNL